MRHQPQNIALTVTNSRDVGEGSIRIRGSISAALEMLSRTRACIAGDNSLEWSDIASNSSRRFAIRSICALTRELSLRPHCGGLRGLKVQFASAQLPGNGTILPLMESPIG